MKRSAVALPTALLTASLLCSGSVFGGLIVVDFDTVGNWTDGSGALTSYQSDHTYAESGLVFTGGPALRQSTTLQDGVAGALGTYGWRLKDKTTVTWTATYSLELGANESISSFGFDARRWDDDPSPNYSVSYSFDGGSSFTTASDIGSSGTLNNAAFSESSAWASFNQAIASPAGLGANQFVVRFANGGSGERIMVDNFNMTVVPEPSALFPLTAMVMALVFVRRRR